ncbi:hypothetical protein Avbf_16893 [Armadillidium vulgare]|nr:hypothetical protein Avbf_16893 [Armadillidium vulgare]
MAQRILRGNPRAIMSEHFLKLSNLFVLDAELSGNLSDFLLYFPKEIKESSYFLSSVLKVVQIRFIKSLLSSQVDFINTVKKNEFCF